MSLFANNQHKPLAEQLRPQTLGDVVGQQHLVGKGEFLNQLINLQQPVSMILWGPPGSGKTTLARIIASSSEGYEFEELSAVGSGIADVKKVIERAKQRQQLGTGTILFVDEIHRFNKAQQDAFLPHVESGTVVLIGATTENPSFEVISPLLSRTRVVVLQGLNDADMRRLIKRALDHLGARKLDKDAEELLVRVAAGDARIVLNGVEAAAGLSKGAIRKKHMEQALQKRALNYDKKADAHYDWISAFIKSMRGSATDAALFYLFRMLEAGEDPKFIARRMVIFASEDVGMASPHALTLAVSTFQAIERIGLPEGEYALAHCAVALSRAPKSRTVTDAMMGAKQAVRDNPAAVPPLHLRNAPTKLMKELGYNQGYKWEADFKHSKGFMPEGLETEKFYNN